jgi:hypothetical protein
LFLVSTDMQRFDLIGSMLINRASQRVKGLAVIGGVRKGLLRGII